MTTNSRPLPPSGRPNATPFLGILCWNSEDAGVAKFPVYNCHSISQELKHPALTYTFSFAWRAPYEYDIVCTGDTRGMRGMIELRLLFGANSGHPPTARPITVDH
jgi:hypothetical protein